MYKKPLVVILTYIFFIHNWSTQGHGTLQFIRFLSLSFANRLAFFLSFFWHLTLFAPLFSWKPFASNNFTLKFLYLKVLFSVISFSCKSFCVTFNQLISFDFTRFPLYLLNLKILLHTKYFVLLPYYNALILALIVRDFDYVAFPYSFLISFSLISMPVL